MRLIVSIYFAVVLLFCQNIFAAEKLNAKDYFQDAGNGDAKAQYRLAVCYYRGYGVKRDCKLAIQNLQLAAAQNYAPAQYSLFSIYLNGKIIEKNYAEGEKYLLLAKKNYNIKKTVKYAALLSDLGKYLCRNPQNKEDFLRGIEYLKESVNIHKNDAVMLLLAIYHFSGVNIPVDYTSAIKYSTPIVEKGNLEAALLLGNCYFQGLGVKKDYVKAFNYMLKAAKKYPEAQLIIAECYFNGIGTAKNWKKALEFYELAAKNGMVKANYKAGLCYKNGCGIEKNRYIAKDYFEAAAKKGHLESMLELKNLFFHEAANTLNFHSTKRAKEYREKAIYYLKKAVEKNHPASIRELAEIYWGEVQKDEELHWSKQTMKKADREAKKQEIFAMYQKAANLGDESAWENLGDCYRDGQMVEKDFEKAINCYEKAAKVCSLKTMETIVDYYYFKKNDDPEYIKWLTLLANRAKYYSDSGKYVERLASYYFRGVHGLKQDYNEAEKYYQLLIREYPYSPEAVEAYRGLGKIYESRNDKELAAKFFAKSKERAEAETIKREVEERHFFENAKRELASKDDTDGEAAYSFATRFRDKLSTEEYEKYLKIASDKGHKMAKFLYGMSDAGIKEAKKAEEDKRRRDREYAEAAKAYRLEKYRREERAKKYLENIVFQEKLNIVLDAVEAIQKKKMIDRLEKLH